MRTGNKIIHVEFKDKYLQPTQDNPEGKHFYFGSLEAIYSVFTNKDIGAQCVRLWRSGIPYNGRKCTIRKGSISRKETNRRAPIQVIHVPHGNNH